METHTRRIQRGKIQNFQFRVVRYLAYYIARGVLARDNTRNISAPDLAILSAALEGRREYNIGALIACRLSTNGEKGTVYGGIVASRILS